MRRAFTIQAASFFAALSLELISTDFSRADSLPTHGAVIHMNPFIPGWPVPPVFAPPAPGTVIPGDGVPADAEYDVLGPISTDIKFGVDALNSPPNPWHWEMEFDLDPYNNRLPGVVPILFDFTAFGGGQYIRNVPIIQGPDIYMHIHQPDCPNSGAETCGFYKFFTNLTTLTPAWGVSVTEDPTGLTLALGKEVQILGDHSQDFFAPENNSGNGMELDFNGSQFVFRQVPEPTSLTLASFAIGLASAMRRRRAA